MSELRHRHAQQMRTFWPCNGFLSPIVPGPNMPLPAPPPMSYVMPIQHAYPSTVLVSAPNADVAGYGQYRGGLRSIHTHSRVYEYERMENERINAGDNYEYMVTNNGEQARNPYDFECEPELKETSSSPRGSSAVNSSDDQLNNTSLEFSASRLAGDGSSNDFLPPMCAPGTSKTNNCFKNDGALYNSDGSVTVSQSRYVELTRLALRGSDIAEKLAYTHRNRPCFKKIDSLCARMRQDLIRPDGVLPNINSQGIAWAIKDMIFVFTRIMSAWIILKGYVYNTPEGLNKVKSALCDDFVTRFLVWQNATYDLSESLVRSFVNLDKLVQAQKAAHQKTADIPEPNNNSTPKANMSRPLFVGKFDYFGGHSENVQPSAGTGLNKNYLYTMVKDSENSQREATVNGTYFKTGTYKPIKKDDYRTDYTTPKKTVVGIENQTKVFPPPPPPPPPPAAPTYVEPTTNNQLSLIQNALAVKASPNPEQMLEASKVLNEYLDEELYEKLYSGKMDIPMVEQCLRERLPSNWLDYGIRMFWRMFAEKTLHTVAESKMPENPHPNPKPIPNLLSILSLMVDRLMAMRSSDLFFKLQFAKNYFPKFIAKYEDMLIDMRTVVLKSQVNKYGHVFEVVHDVRRIFYFAKIYLTLNVDPALLKAINEFQNEFDNLLHDEPFNLYRYDHIIGDPQENLYL